MNRSARVIAAGLAALLTVTGVAGCSDDGDSAAPVTTQATGSTTTTTGPASTTIEGPVDAGCTTAETGPLRVMVSNDDGVINPAIDVLLASFARQTEIDLDVTVVAPAEERSGSSDLTTPEGVTYTEGTTPSGYDAYAVDGYPADSVIVALDQLGLQPQLVVSGINPGQNFGPYAPVSGTVGVARTASRRGLPALAVSGGMIFDQAQFQVGADLALDWISENCAALVAGEMPSDVITSINLPDCHPEDMGPLQEVPLAATLPEVPEGDTVFNSLCDLADPAPANDVAAVRSGYPAITQYGPEL